MSYVTTPRYEAEILSRNRLAPSPEPAMGNNPGRNAPLNRTDDSKQVVYFTEWRSSSQSELNPAFLYIFANILVQPHIVTAYMLEAPSSLGYLLMPSFERDTIS
jgi:hypothetical protein